MTDQDGAIDTTGNARLYAKMAEVMDKLQRLEKDGHNSHFNYGYVTAGQVAETFRHLFAEVGLAFFASTLNVQVTESRYIVQYQYTFACTETGATHICTWFGEAVHTSGKGVADDKALNKAATTALKYFLLATFIGSAGDMDVDSDQQPKGRSQQQPGRPAPAQRTQQQAGAGSIADFRQHVDGIRNGSEPTAHFLADKDNRANIYAYAGAVFKTADMNVDAKEVVLNVLIEATAGEISSIEQFTGDEIEVKAHILARAARYEPANVSKIGGMGKAAEVINNRARAICLAKVA